MIAMSRAPVRRHQTAQTVVRRWEDMAERDAQGRFAEGNPGGPGNPHAKRVGELRVALLEAVTPADMQAVVKALVEAAKGGDVAAARVLFERVLGKPVEADLIERLEVLEQQLEVE